MNASLPVPEAAGDRRRGSFRAVDGAHYDVAIFGAGINGARIFRELCQHGCRDRGTHPRPRSVNRADALGRFPPETGLPDYARLHLPETERENRRLIKLPNFCHPDQGLLDQYRAAFEHALAEQA